MTSLALTALALAAFATPAAGQHDQRSEHAGAGSEEVKTLTPEEVAELRNAEGMGMARPAELNGYPGPRHVLDLADSLQLSAEQREATEAIFADMQTRAKALGDSIIEAEKALDGAFARGAGAPSLEEAVHAVARLRGVLRWAHLEAHLGTAELLSMHQRHTYDRLRGYGGHVH